MGQERTDEELLAAYQQGDPGAFELLLRRHRAPLFSFLLRMLGDREKAEDLAQETFLRIVKGAQAWEHRARFQTWLFTIARNLCVDASRRDRFRRADSLDQTGPDDEPAMVDSVPGHEIDPARGAESARLRPVLQKALLGLPAEQREVFILREQAGIPFKEIAEMVGVNENTVKSRMRYALEGLRKALLAAGVDAETSAEEPAPGVRLGRA
ncbi:MAG: RNA polymerase sigma factor [Myxococcales bacterium]